jgi:hypothetical protein
VAFNPSGTTRTADQAFIVPQLPSPQLTGLIRQPDRTLLLGLNGTPGARYTVQTSTNLSQWTDAGTVTAASDGSGQLIVTNANLPKQFFRPRYP